ACRRRSAGEQLRAFAGGRSRVQSAKSADYGSVAELAASRTTTYRILQAGCRTSTVPAWSERCRRNLRLAVNRLRTRGSFFHRRASEAAARTGYANEGDRHRRKLF